MTYSPKTEETAREVEKLKDKQYNLISRLRRYSTILILGSALSAFASSFGARYLLSGMESNNKRHIENTIEGKVLELEEAKVTLGNLIKFIDKQQDSLYELSANLDKIKQEKKEIEPILSLSKEQARALLTSYESRINVWEERGWGFAIGLLTSVLGGFVLLYSSKIHIFKKKQSE